METVLRLRKLYSRPYFTEQSETLQRNRRIMYHQEYERIKKIIDVERGGNILDIGCGDGAFLRLFSDKWRKFGIEISEHAQDIARKSGIVTDFELKDDFFDVIIFRGTLQHIPDPVYKIGECYYWLKKGGWIIFLATPNTNSIVYKLFNTLPMLEPERNFLLPSDLMLRQILTNFGFTVMTIEYPYLGTPYANPIRDICYFVLALLQIRRKVDFPFYRNVMECYATKE